MLIFWKIVIYIKSQTTIKYFTATVERVRQKIIEEKKMTQGEKNKLFNLISINFLWQNQWCDSDIMSARNKLLSDRFRFLLHHPFLVLGVYCVVLWALLCRGFCFICLYHIPPINIITRVSYLPLRDAKYAFDTDSTWKT